jgi:hypothetical protein
MAHGDNPADRYNHRGPRERDRERPVDAPEASDGKIDHFDAASERDRARRSLLDSDDDRAGAGGAPDGGPGDPGGTLGTGGRREQDM